MADSKSKSDEIYIDCSPTGESADNIKSYNVPINSEYTEDAKKLDLMRTLIGLCVMLVYLTFVYFIAPMAYKYGVINIVNKLLSGNTNEERLERIGSVDIYLSFTIIGLAIYFFSKGSVEFDFVLLMCGFSILLMYGLSFGLIQSNKVNEDYMSTFIASGRERIKSMYPIDDQRKIYQDLFFKAFRDLFAYLQQNQYAAAACFVVFWIWEIIVLVLYYIDKGKFISTRFFYEWSLYFPVFILIPFCIFISLLFKRTSP